MAEHEPIGHRFMDLEVPEYAYMFGFLQADGHLYQGAGRKGRLSVELNFRDIDLLYRFKQLTPYNSSVTERTRSTNFTEDAHSAVWTLCSLDARTLINTLGVPYGRKSESIAPPHGKEFSQRDYLRGIIDADGSIGYTSQGLPFVSLTTSSTAVGSFLSGYACRLVGAERTLKRNARDQVYNIMYTKEAAQALAADLYYPGCLALGRKQVKADSLRSWIRPGHMRVAPGRWPWTPEEDQALLQINDAAVAAEQLGRSKQSCYMRLWRLRTGRVPTPTGK